MLKIEDVLMKNNSGDLAEKLMSEMAHIQDVSKDIKEEMEAIDEQTK